MSDQLPQGWVSTPVKRVIDDFQPGFASGEKNVEGGVAHLRMNNIGLDGKLVLDLVRTVPKKLAKPRHDLSPGDVLVCTTNSGALVGKCAHFDLPGRYAFSNHLTRLRPKRDVIDGRFLRWNLWLHWKRGVFDDKCKHWVNPRYRKTHCWEMKSSFRHSPSSGGLWRSWRHCWAKWTPASSGWRRFPSCSNAFANPSSPPPAPAASPPIGGRRMFSKMPQHSLRAFARNVLPAIKTPLFVMTWICPTSQKLGLGRTSAFCSRPQKRFATESFSLERMTLTARC